MSTLRLPSAAGPVLAAAAVAGWIGLATGAISIDLGVGRRDRRLGPLTVAVEASRERVFDLMARPYLHPHASRGPEVLERTADMVLARHTTPLPSGLKATTVETVRFTRPERLDFRLARGPVPAVVETIELSDHGTGTRLEYRGTMSTDLWGLGERWGRAVARRWEATVAAHLASIRDRAGPH